QGPAPELVRLDAAAPQAPATRAPGIGPPGGEGGGGKDPRPPCGRGLLPRAVVEPSDQRPATGQVFALTSINRLLLLDPATGALSQPGAPLEPALFAAGQPSGIDFTPTVDRLRLVSG